MQLLWRLHLSQAVEALRRRRRTRRRRRKTWFDKDGNLLSVDKYTPVYDEPYVSDQIAKGNVSGTAEDACHLTVIFNPAREDQEVQEFDIVKGTLVNVTSNEDYSLYSSGDCTEKIDTIDTNADETTVYVMRNGQ
ncbi:MAG: hypothetical protein MSA09_11995 [Lachnospiraceae bacterium]|nr:hypothetical protein [Lachnospiraceae bacterium]